MRSVHPGASTAEGIRDGALQEVRPAAERNGLGAGGDAGWRPRGQNRGG